MTNARSFFNGFNGEYVVGSVKELTSTNKKHIFLN